MTLDEFIDWAGRYRAAVVENVYQRLRHYPLLARRHHPPLQIAQELALGGVKAALGVANHHRRFPGFLGPHRSLLWLREEAYCQALRLLPEHDFVGPFFVDLGPDDYVLLCWLYVDQLNDRQLASILRIGPHEARRRGWQAYQLLCSRLLQGGWGTDDATLPVYPLEFGRLGFGLSGAP